jgi:hypothetical protein
VFWLVRHADTQPAKRFFDAADVSRYLLHDHARAGRCQMSSVTDVVVIGATEEEMAAIIKLLGEAIGGTLKPLHDAFAENSKCAQGQWWGGAFNDLVIPGFVTVVRASVWMFPSDVSMVFQSDGFDGVLVVQLSADKSPRYLFHGDLCGPDHWLFMPGRALDPRA